MKRQLARRQRAVPICQRKLALVPLQLVNPVWVHDDAVDFNRHVQRCWWLSGNALYWRRQVASAAEMR